MRSRRRHLSQTDADRHVHHRGDDVRVDEDRRASDTDGEGQEDEDGDGGAGGTVVDSQGGPDTDSFWGTDEGALGDGFLAVSRPLGIDFVFGHHFGFWGLHVDVAFDAMADR